MSLKAKSEIRSYYKELRKNYCPEAKSEADRIIAEKLFRLFEYKNCKTLLAFVSKDIEVDTALITARAFSDGKTIAVPKCNPKKGLMKFYRIKSYNDLEQGYFEIYEPKNTCPEQIDFSDSICLVPGLVYDSDCFRIGFGGGYYDRFLCDFPGVSVGICYSDCFEKQIPKDEFDRPVDILITDSAIYRKDNGYGL